MVTTGRKQGGLSKEHRSVANIGGRVVIFVKRRVQRAGTYGLRGENEGGVTGRNRSLSSWFWRAKCWPHTMELPLQAVLKTTVVLVVRFGAENSEQHVHDKRTGPS